MIHWLVYRASHRGRSVPFSVWGQVCSVEESGTAGTSRWEKASTLSASLFLGLQASRLEGAPKNRATVTQERRVFFNSVRLSTRQHLSHCLIGLVRNV